MNHIECNQKLSSEFPTSKFSAQIGETGGYITFSNSRKGGAKKYFTISLHSLLTIFKDIKADLTIFNQHEEYVEKEWRDLGSQHYSDDTANALSTVQTKALFSTINKIAYLATNDKSNTDSFIKLSETNVDRSIVFLENLISEYTPNIKNNMPILSTLEAFKVDKFIADTAKSHLKFSNSLLFRFISSLQTKPFTILTGLSGSGKTKLAEAFSLWITNGLSESNIFIKGQEVEATNTTYTIKEVDSIGLLTYSAGSKNAFLPIQLIKNWVDVIQENHFDRQTASQDIQKKVNEKGIDFNPTMNSFHAQLKAFAFKYIESITEQHRSNINAQVCMVAVGSDWTNREPLLGFPNALESNQYVKPDSGVLDILIAASNDPKRPYFLILDEMNMSHVERYFADFLSAMESVDGSIALHSGTEDWNGVPPKIILPKNLFIIGTVNIDETTYMFSPKVLDRANVIEFRVSDSEMESFFKAPTGLDMNVLRGAGATMGESFVAKALETELFEPDLGDVLMPFFTRLQEAGAEFGYRTASEMSRFVAVCSELAGNQMDKDSIIDAAIMQKLLPKLHGSRNKIEPILNALGELCLEDSSLDAFLLDSNNKDKHPIKYALSYEKLMRMHKRVITDGFTSFAEA